MKGKTLNAASLAVVLFVSIAFASCGPSGPKVNLEGTEVVVRNRATIEGSRSSLGVYDNFFDPTILRGAQNAAVTFDLKNNGRRVHNITVPSQAIDQDVPPGVSSSVAVMLPASGRLVFYCKFHREDSGMAGAFEPLPSASP